MEKSYRKRIASSPFYVISVFGSSANFELLDEKTWLIARQMQKDRAFFFVHNIKRGHKLSLPEILFWVIEYHLTIKTSDRTLLNNIIRLKKQ